WQRDPAARRLGGRRASSPGLTGITTTLPVRAARRSAGPAHKRRYEMRWSCRIDVPLLVLATPALAQADATAASPAAPLAVGETFTIRSKVLDETRRINVYLPPIYEDSANVRLPVLYMPDGGMREDFLHVAGLVQVSVGNGTMRPFVLVGIENT